MSKTVLLWDIDGTLLLTGGAGQNVFENIFWELHQCPGIWRGVTVDGRTDDIIIDELYLKSVGRLPTDAERQKFTARYHELMELELTRAPHFRLMPHVLETLERLSKAGHLQGLATGNFERAAWAKLKRGGLDHFFSFGGFGTDSRDRQTLTQRALERAIIHLGGSPKETFIIGDTIHDVACGKGIGAKTVAVCTGSTPRKTLEESGADWVLDDLTEFKRIL